MQGMNTHSFLIFFDLFFQFSLRNFQLAKISKENKILVGIGLEENVDMPKKGALNYRRFEIVTVQKGFCYDTLLFKEIVTVR